MAAGYQPGSWVRAKSPNCYTNEDIEEDAKGLKLCHSNGEYAWQCKSLGEKSFVKIKLFLFGIYLARKKCAHNFGWKIKLQKIIPIEE